MKRPLLLAVEPNATVFAPLIEAAAAGGFRIGWLDLTASDPPPPSLEAAAAAGALRAVAAGASRTLTVKPRRGAAVLDDLLREHFRGCSLVLVSRAASSLPTSPALRVAPDLPTLAPAQGDGWRITDLAGNARTMATPELVQALGRPSFWRD